MARSLLILGTASHVGKSVVAAGFCRLLSGWGLRVAPFKAQNMALNSFVTRTGGEIGRAQVAQAEAASVEPETDMNPILLKPMGGVSQVIVDGEPIGVLSAREYYAEKPRLWLRATAAYDRLSARFDAVVIEGAGSPAEINLRDHDLANLGMLRHAEPSAVLVADIERGGVFAQIVGTWELLAKAERSRIVGFIINKFRGDVSLLDSGLAYLRERTGVPVLGVLPHRGDLGIDQEDSLGIDSTASTAGVIDVAVVRLPGLSNFTDFAPLGRFPGVGVRYVADADSLGRPDLVILPGTKTTVRDLLWLRDRGLDRAIIALAEDPGGPLVLGVCGGFQMLGRRIDDPLGVESSEPSVGGLALLDVETRFAAEKMRHIVTGSVHDGGHPFAGYEIHMGRTTRGEGARPFAILQRARGGERLEDGAVDRTGRIFGTYVHGLFDGEPFTAALLNRLRARRGLAPLSETAHTAHRAGRADAYEAVAEMLRAHLDLGPIRRALGLAP